MFAGDVPAEAWVCDSFVVVVVDVRVTDYTWVLDTLQVFVWQQAHVSKLLHALDQFDWSLQDISVHDQGFPKFLGFSGLAFLVL